MKKVIALIVGLLVVSVTFVIYSYTPETGYAVNKEREQALIDFIENRDVPLNKAFWLFEGMSLSTDQMEIMFYCKRLEIDNWKYVWHNLRDFRHQTIKYTGKATSIEKLRDRPIPK